MDEKIVDNVYEIKEKVAVITTKLDEYLKEIEETKGGVKDLDQETGKKVETLTNICKELKDSIIELEKTEAKNQSIINFIVKAFWVMFSTMVGILAYIFKGAISSK